MPLGATKTPSTCNSRFMSVPTELYPLVGTCFPSRNAREPPGPPAHNSIAQTGLASSHTHDFFKGQTKAIGKSWKALAPEQRLPFEMEAEKDRKRYEREVFLFKREKGAERD